ncbi:MAG: YdcF family protein [Flammeovirgaceae bacterium]
MFYVLSKTIYVLGMPMTWVLLLIGYSLFAKGRKKNIIIGITFLFLYLSSTPQIVNRLMLAWELPGTPYQAITQPYDVGIILSGPVKHNKAPYDRVHIDKGSGRFLHAAELYHKGLVKTLLVTGGHQQIKKKMINEAVLIKKVLLQAGVPDSVIILEKQAKNTHENAKLSAELLRAQFPNQRYLVITSAFHMRRSLACFRSKKVQLAVDGFSTDFYTTDPDKVSSFMSYLPNARAFDTFNVLAKEVMGYVVYKLVGYA